MEENKSNEPNVRVYVENGCKFKVKRQFEKDGTTVLEQVISLLLDIMEKREKELTDKT